MGGFRRRAGRLAGLAELGVTAVELMPINDFPGQRNWGYDGVLPFAPDRSYGTPDELKALIDAAHGLGLMVFLDVVYNHFGPDGNYLAALCARLLPATTCRRRGVRRSTSGGPRCARFFTENALYWLMEYRFDGLRFDAVHAICDPDWLDEMAAERAAPPSSPAATCISCWSTTATRPSTCAASFNAQWNDDAHHVLHVLLTGERDGYYADYAERPADKLARCLAEGFAYQGERSPYRKGEPRGSPERATCRPPRSCCSCRTTIRSATGRSATA